MNTFLIEDEKFIKDKPDFLLKFSNINLKIIFFENSFFIDEFTLNFIKPIEKLYKDKTLLFFETDYDCALKCLTLVSQKYFCSSSKIFVKFTKTLNNEDISYTQNIELNNKNFDIEFFENKVKFYLLIDKMNFI